MRSSSPAASMGASTLSRMAARCTATNVHVVGSSTLRRRVPDRPRSPSIAPRPRPSRHRAHERRHLDRLVPRRLAVHRGAPRSHAGARPAGGPARGRAPRHPDPGPDPPRAPRHAPGPVLRSPRPARRDARRRRGRLAHRRRAARDRRPGARCGDHRRRTRPAPSSRRGCRRACRTRRWRAARCRSARGTSSPPARSGCTAGSTSCTPAACATSGRRRFAISSTPGTSWSCPRSGTR